jgi:hypothetical protein
VEQRRTAPGAAVATTDQNSITVMLAEYSAVRAEVIQALQSQHAIVSYGVSVVGLLSAVAIGTAAGAEQTGRELVAFVFLILNPLLVVVIFMVWGSEVLRMHRAGMYLFVVERVLNAHVTGPRPLNWEHAVNPPPTVEQTGDRMRTHTVRRLPHVDLLQRIAVPSALLTITIGSITAGLLVGTFHWLVILSIMSIIAGFAGWAWLESERRRLRVLYGQVCEFERSKKSAGEAFTMEAWVDDLKSWPSLRDRLK